jgi:ATP adenylyltransferase
MPEFRDNLWAPWRMEYIDGLPEQTKGECFICRYRDNPADDQKNLVLWRGPRTLTLLNRFPYTSGHVLVAPADHLAEPEELPDDVLLELARRTRDAQRVLRETLHPQGYNIGMNLGKCAGAGLPAHLHWHIVPRWNGDTNFMPIIGDVRVIPQSLTEIWRLFRAGAEKLRLPGAPA